MTRPVVLASNRGPLAFSSADGALVAKRGAGGLISGLTPLVAGTDTLWIAAALSDGDREAAAEGVIEAEGLRVRTLAIDPEILERAYDDVCNAVLWFLYHGMQDLMNERTFDSRWDESWDCYRSYNQEFAAVIAAEAPADAVVLVQDYHLALLGPMLRAERPDLATVHFSHTPFARPEWLQILPRHHAVELLEGMAGHDVCGFHSARWAEDFRASCAELLGREPATFVAPLAPDPDDIRAAAAAPRTQDEVRAIEESIGDRQLIVRVDRIELSKNLVRGFEAFDVLLTSRPDLHERVVFRSLGYPSRESIPEYKYYREDMERIVGDINRHFGTPDWTPVELDLEDDFLRSVAHLRRSDVLLVNPIRDGLNLVAKEGPLVNERNTSLILSTEAGIHDELSGAVLSVDPYDVAGQAVALSVALDRSKEERAAAFTELLRLAELRTPADWMADQLAAVGAS